MGTRFYKSAMDTQAFGIVPAYRRYELYWARFHEMQRILKPLLDTGRELSILDVGAGMGDAKKFIDPLGGNARWVAVEGDPRRVPLLPPVGYAEVHPEIDLEHQALPFPDGAFDVVIASHVLEHLANADRALADWHRVLKPGGTLLLGVPMHLGVVAALARLRFRLFGRKPRAHCHFFSMRTLRRLLHGYDVREIWGFRVLSARQQLPLEDSEAFYRWSLWMGRRFPGLTAEVNVHVKKGDRLL